MEVPNKGRDIYEVLKDLNNEVLNYLYRRTIHVHSHLYQVQHHVYRLGDILTTANNIHASNFANATLPINIERNLINYLVGKIGYEIKPAGGVFVSGGSMANLTAIVAARDAQVEMEDIKKQPFILHLKRTHHSVGKALHVAGFLKNNIRRIGYNDDFTMNTDSLKAAIDKDIEEGYKPAMVIATAGTTNTGSVDDFTTLGDICDHYNLWLHVDGAYGLSHILSDKAHLFKGIERSDGASWDALTAFQTYSCAMVIVKEKIICCKALAKMLSTWMILLQMMM